MNDNLPFPICGGDYVHKGNAIVSLPSVEADKPVSVQVQEKELETSTVAEAAVPEEDEQEQPSPASEQLTPPWQR